MPRCRRTISKVAWIFCACSVANLSRSSGTPRAMSLQTGVYSADLAQYSHHYWTQIR